MKLGQVLEINEGLARLGREKLPVGIAFDVKREAAKIRDTVRAYEEARRELAASLGATEEAGRMTIPPERRDEFLAQHRTLLDREIEYEPRVIVREADLQGREIEAETLGLLGGLCE